jgi:hypothetical protein
MEMFRTQCCSVAELETNSWAGRAKKKNIPKHAILLEISH